MMYLLLTAAYLVASSLVLHSHQTGFEFDEDHHSVPNSTKAHILIASVRRDGYVVTFELDIFVDCRI